MNKKKLRKHLRSIASSGGKATVKKYGKKYMSNLAKKRRGALSK